MTARIQLSQGWVPILFIQWKVDGPEITYMKYELSNFILFVNAHTRICMHVTVKKSTNLWEVQKLNTNYKALTVWMCCLHTCAQACNSPEGVESPGTEFKDSEMPCGCQGLNTVLLGHLFSPYFWGFAVLGHCEWDGIPWSFSASTEELGPSVHGGTYLYPKFSGQPLLHCKTLSGGGGVQKLKVCCMSYDCE